jgi:hypothetical protein
LKYWFVSNFWIGEKWLFFGFAFIGPKKVRKPKSDDDGDMSTDENDEDEDEMSVDDTLDENLFEIPANFAEDPSRYCQILAMNIH